MSSGNYRRSPSLETAEGSDISRRAAICGAAALGLLGLEALGAGAAFASALRVGATAPPANLASLNGERLSTSELRGQVVILCFWATWCVPCRAELAILAAYSALHAHEGLQVLGFSLDDAEDLAKVQAVAATLPFPNGLLTPASAPGYGRIWRLPVNFVIARDGRLASNGWLEKNPAWTADRLEQLVTPLLAEVPLAPGAPPRTAF
jgi:cytochrome c biogenesis protein CcmG, thiol:disulfide interchange protein DsbE